MDPTLSYYRWRQKFENKCRGFKSESSCRLVTPWPLIFLLICQFLPPSVFALGNDTALISGSVDQTGKDTPTSQIPTNHEGLFTDHVTQTNEPIVSGSGSHKGVISNAIPKHDPADHGDDRVPHAKGSKRIDISKDGKAIVFTNANLINGPESANPTTAQDRGDHVTFNPVIQGSNVTVVTKIRPDLGKSENGSFLIAVSDRETILLSTNVNKSQKLTPLGNVEGKVGDKPSASDCLTLPILEEELKARRTILALMLPSHFLGSKAPNTSYQLGITTHYVKETNKLEIMCIGVTNTPKNGPKSNHLKYYKTGGTIMAVVPLFGGVGGYNFLEYFRGVFESKLEGNGCGSLVESKVHIKPGGELLPEPVAIVLKEIVYRDCALQWPIPNAVREDECYTDDPFPRMTILRKYGPNGPAVDDSSQSVGIDERHVFPIKFDRLTLDGVTIRLPPIDSQTVTKCPNTRPGRLGSIDMVRCVVQPWNFSGVFSTKDQEMGAGSSLRAIFAILSRIAPTLEYLNISDTQFEGVEGQGFDSNSSINFSTTLPALKILILNGNGLRSRDLNLLPLMPQLDTLELKRNLITHLTGVDLETRFGSLKNLDISGNMVKGIGGHEIHNFKLPPGLRTLNLSGNQLGTAQETEPLTNRGEIRWNSLETLDLSHNGLTELGEVLKFSVSFPSLESIRLDWNNFTEIPGALKHLKVLREIHAAQNFIADLRTVTWDDDSLQTLNYLDISQNKIEIIPTGTFVGLKNLRILLLADNEINRIEPLSLHNLMHLEILDLSGNRIADVSGLFGFLPSISHLDMSRNFISTLKLEEVPGSVQSLNLSANHLTEVIGRLKVHQPYDYVTGENLAIPLSSSNPNEDDDGLQILDLSRNFLKTINSSAIFPGTLTHLNISFNSLSSIDEEAFFHLPSLLELSLDSNRLNNLSSRIFTHPSPRRSTLEVYLASNPYECDCQMTWLPRAISRAKDSGNSTSLQGLVKPDYEIMDAGALTCYHRYYDAWIPIMSSAASSISSGSGDLGSWLCSYREQCFSLCPCCEFFYCDCKMICPTSCDCYRDTSWTINAVRCDSRSLTRVPDNMPRFATVLRLDGNNVSTLARSVLFAFFDLEHLYLNSSGLVGTLGSRSLGKLPRLLTLNLSDNSISGLPLDLFVGTGALEALDLSFNSLSYLASQTFSGLRSLKSLNLMHNFISHMDATFLSLLYLLSHQGIPSGGLSVAQEASNSDGLAFAVALANNPLDCRDCDMTEFMVRNLSRAVGDGATCRLNGTLTNPSIQLTLKLVESLVMCPNFTTQAIMNHVPPVTDVGTIIPTDISSSELTSTDNSVWWERILIITQEIHPANFGQVIPNVSTTLAETTDSPKIFTGVTSLNFTEVSTGLSVYDLDLVEEEEEEEEFGGKWKKFSAGHLRFLELVGIVIAIIIGIVSVWIICMRCVLRSMACKHKKRKKNTTTTNPSQSHKPLLARYLCADTTGTCRSLNGTPTTKNLGGYGSQLYQKPPKLSQGMQHVANPRYGLASNRSKFLGDIGSLLRFSGRGRNRKKYTYDLFVSYGQKEQSFVEQTLGPKLERDRYKLCLQYPQEMYVTDVIRETVDRSRRIILLLPCKVWNYLGSRRGSVGIPDPYRDMTAIYHDLFLGPIHGEEEQSLGLGFRAKTLAYPDNKRVVLLVVPDNMSLTTCAGSTGFRGSARDVDNCLIDTSTTETMVPLMPVRKGRNNSSPPNNRSQLTTPDLDQGSDFRPEDPLQKSVTSVSSLNYEADLVRNLTNHPMVNWTDDLFWEKLKFLIGSPMGLRKIKQPITEL